MQDRVEVMVSLKPLEGIRSLQYSNHDEIRSPFSKDQESPLF